jgi:hypothetical protein
VCKQAQLYNSNENQFIASEHVPSARCLQFQWTWTIKMWRLIVLRAGTNISEETFSLEDSKGWYQSNYTFMKIETLNVT